MTAKIEAGDNWMCKVHDSWNVKSEMPAVEMEQPIIINTGDKYSSIGLHNVVHTGIDIHTYEFHSTVSIGVDIDSGNGREMDLSKATGIVQMTKPVLRGEAAAFVSVTKYVLSGREAMVQFGQPGNPDYLKVTHEMEQRGQLVSG